MLNVGQFPHSVIHDSPAENPRPAWGLANPQPFQPGPWFAQITCLIWLPQGKVGAVLLGSFRDTG